MNAEVRMMNYRLQLSPISGTRESSIDLPSREFWEGGSRDCEDANFCRFWLEYDSDMEHAHTAGRVNWNLVLGLALAVLVSTSFWLGIGMIIIGRVWK
jgi:hypothetical protein